VTVVVTDTVREITTVTVRENELGDTLRITTVTDRTRATSRDHIHDVQEKVILKTDTVYIERDSLQLTAYGLQNPGSPPVSSKQSTVSQILKWIFWILAALVALIIALRIFVFRR
jgi:hypothetical protein